ncbi:MAG: DUF3459 domain-containing protein [Spartobacteria bacterium]|nr:DUF3459 domain-containing protein [Spartobacteria bacterium]
MKYSNIPPFIHIQDLFSRLYGDQLANPCMARLHAMFNRYGIRQLDAPIRPFDENDSLLIAYGDTLTDNSSKADDTSPTPLRTLDTWCTKHLSGAINTIHILPFCPYSSDDGFSVIDYREVDPALGTWKDIQAMHQHFHLMFDLVLNHVSRQSSWFGDFVTGVAPYRDYFIQTDEFFNASKVVRPRSSALFSEVKTRLGTTNVWTTFSSDQIDLNYRNPDVLFEMLDILFFYIVQGAAVIRLDAIAYLWKESGTSCIHHTNTHTVVQLIRAVLTITAPHVRLLTETNVPHKENISYFGHCDEAQIIYQFTLPPLLLHTLLTENASVLTQWAKDLLPPPDGCTFLNFTASHDGIGVRPLENLLPDNEVKKLAQHVLQQGGKVSSKTNTDGTSSPYELNITYFDALTKNTDESYTTAADRFICSQLIMLSLQGIPALYFSSLFGGRNDYEKVKKTNMNRSINREKWDIDALDRLIKQPDTAHAAIFKTLIQALQLRRTTPAFSPLAVQQIISVNERVFAVLRGTQDQYVLCLFNISSQPFTLTQHPAMPKTPMYNLLNSEEVLKPSAPLVMPPFSSYWFVPSQP